MRVVNTGSAAGSARIYAVDATTGATSGASYLTDSARRTDVGAWTRLSTGRVHLRPRQSTTVSFTVRVPRGVRSGDHLGGIVADPGIQHGRAVRRNRSSFRINVRTLTVIAVEARLPGKSVPQLALRAVVIKEPLPVRVRGKIGHGARGKLITASSVTSWRKRRIRTT